MLGKGVQSPSPLYLILPFFDTHPIAPAPYLNVGSFPGKTFCIWQPLNQSKKGCSYSTKINLSVQVQLLDKIQLYQLCIQDSKKVRHPPFLLNPPFLPAPHFLQKLLHLPVLLTFIYLTPNPPPTLDDTVSMQCL